MTRDPKNRTCSAEFFDTDSANTTLDELMSKLQLPEDILRREEMDRSDTERNVLNRQLEFGSLARRIVEAPMGHPDAEIAYYSAYLIPRILDNLQLLERGGDAVTGIRDVAGRRIDAAVHGIVIGPESDFNSMDDLWELYKSTFAGGNFLRKKMEREGLNGLIGSEKHTDDVKKIRVYTPEYADLMFKSAQGAGVDFKQLIGTLTKQILSTYGQHQDHSQLILERDRYVYEMMRVFFEQNGYLDDFREQDETFLGCFESLSVKIQEMIYSFSEDKPADHESKIREVLKETLKSIAVLTNFYTSHVVHSGVLMRGKYTLSEEILAAGIASIKWHLLLSHFILVQRRLLGPR